MQLPSDSAPEDVIKTPENALYFAALGAVEFGKGEDSEVGEYLGISVLSVTFSKESKGKPSFRRSRVVSSRTELEEFTARYRRPRFPPATFRPGERVQAFLGLDGGSTSTKAVLLSEKGEVLCKAYRLSNGNPIQDTIDLFENPGSR